jgi:S1-C subfamily serine protease
MTKYLVLLLLPIFAFAAQIENTMDAIKIPSINFSKTPLAQTVSTLNVLSKDADPNKRGIILIIEDPETMIHSVTASATNISYRAALDLILNGSNFHYSIEGSIILIRRRDLDSGSNSAKIGVEVISGEKKEAVYTIEVEDTSSGRKQKKAGTGFLAGIKGRSFIVTNQHVVDGVCDASQITVLNLRGERVNTGRAWAAVDHDLIIIEAISGVSESYRYEFHPDIQKIKRGDSVIAIGNPLGGGTILEAKGSVVGLGPRKVELDISVFGGNSGGPVIHNSSDYVVGIVTEGKLVAGDIFTKISKDRSDSPINTLIRIYSTRFDSISKWEEISWIEWGNQKKNLGLHIKRLQAFWALANSSTDPFTSNRDRVIEIPEIWDAFQRFERERQNARSREQADSNLKFMVRTIDALFAPGGSFRSDLNKSKTYFYSWNQNQRYEYPFSIELIEDAYAEAYKHWTLNKETIFHELKLRSGEGM